MSELAFYGHKSSKKQYLARAELAEKQLAAGTNRRTVFWTGRKPCNGSCHPRSCNHTYFGTELSVSGQFAYAERGIFLGLPDDKAWRWPSRFVRAIPVGLSTSKTIWRDLAIYILTDPDHGLLSYARTHEQRTAILEIAELYRKNETNPQAWKDASTKATQASWGGPPGNRFLECEESITQMGCRAAIAASHFADAFSHMQSATKAIEDAAWCARDRRYAIEMVDVGTLKENQEAGNSVSWFSAVNRATSVADDERKQMHARYASKLIRLLKIAGYKQSAYKVGTFLAGLVKLRKKEVVQH